MASGVSWLTVFEKVGAALEESVARVRGLISAREDRRLGELAATTREQSVEVLRQIIDVDPDPLRIQRPAKVEKSERAQRERQVPLFSDLPAIRNCRRCRCWTCRRTRSRRSPRRRSSTPRA